MLVFFYTTKKNKSKTIFLCGFFWVVLPSLAIPRQSSRAVFPNPGQRRQQKSMTSVSRKSLIDAIPSAIALSRSPTRCLSQSPSRSLLRPRSFLAHAAASYPRAVDLAVPRLPPSFARRGSEGKRGGRKPHCW